MESVERTQMESMERKKEMVRTTIHKERKPPGADFVTWEDCANVRFREVDRGHDADFRITFEPENGKTWYWSMVGRRARAYSSPETTMMLEGLPDTFTSPHELEMHRGLILHEFGHALGLQHEHQSPSGLSMGDDVKLNPKTVIDHYFRVEMSKVPVEDREDPQVQKEAMERAKEEANTNVLVRFKPEDLTNYTRFDTDSIMR
ncbi:hypothetical protein OG21DRAFT_333406 [Imleria badia]|nr:hypothetical protein OG21DRAFT_333406 [Imleria badia]